MGDRFATLFECSLNFPSASYLDIQCMPGGRMSQCYINIIRNPFVAKNLARLLWASSKNKGKQAKGKKHD